MTQTLRYVDAGLYVVVVLELLIINWPRRGRLDFGEALTRVALILLFAVSAFALYDAARDQLVGGEVRLILITTSLTLLVLGLGFTVVKTLRLR